MARELMTSAGFDFGVVSGEGTPLSVVDARDSYFSTVMGILIFHSTFAAIQSLVYLIILLSIGIAVNKILFSEYSISATIHHRAS
jgi:hypothetical protein